MSESNSNQQGGPAERTPAAMSLTELLVTANRWRARAQAEFDRVVDRKAAELALRDPDARGDPAVVRALERVRDAEVRADALRLETPAAFYALRRYHGDAAERVAGEEPFVGRFVATGDQGFLPRVWQYIVNELYRLGRLKMDRDRLCECCARAGARAAAGGVWPGGAHWEAEIDRLDREGFAEKLLAGLWARFPAAAAEMGLRRAVPPATERAADRPTERGYVAAPVDPAAYVPAADILARHTPAELAISMKELGTILEDYDTNRVRWTRPLGKSGQPMRNRRSVHLGDWTAYLKRRVPAEADGFPWLSEAELESRKAAVRNSKHAGE